MSDDSKSTLKIRCPSCAQKLDVSGVPPFSTIKCPKCRGTITVPRRFGSLLLEELIGEGRVSKVYRALDTTLDREAAVKVAKKTFHENAAEGAVFLAEAKKMAVLIHPRIVPIYSCGEVEDQAFLAMQYMAGRALAARLPAAKSGLPAQTCLDYAMGVAQGLDAAFQKGILHHNVCPANVLIDADGEAKIGDFGLACAAWNEGRDLRENLRACFSSLAYASPEKGLTGKEDVRGDIYSLGATLYHMLTGRAPFFGENTDEAFRQRVAEAPLPPRALQNEIPESLDGLVMAMMAGKPEDRPQTYAEVLAGIGICKQTLRNRRPAPTAPRKRPAPIPAGPRPQPRRPVVPGAAPKPVIVFQPRKRLELRLAILLVLLLLVSLLTVSAVQRRPWYVEHIEPALRTFRSFLVGQPLSDRPRVKAAPVEPKAEATHEDEGTEVAPPASQDEPKPAIEPQMAPDDAPAQPAGASQAAGGDPAAKPGEKPPPAKPGNGETWTADQPGGKQADPVPEKGPPSETVAQEPPAKTAPAAKLPEYIAARPRPADLDFLRIEDALRAYIKSVPVEHRETEQERIRITSTIRTDLIRLFRYPYEDPEHGVKLRSGVVLQGALMANDKELILKPPRRSKFRELKWSDLAFEQFPACLEFYIRQRLTHANPAAGEGGEAALGKALGALAKPKSEPQPRTDGAATRRQEAGYDYFRLALLCDWYAKPKDARRYAGLAVSTDPTLAGPLDKFLPGSKDAPVTPKAK